MSKKQTTPIVTREMQRELVQVYRRALATGMSLDEVEEKIDKHVARLSVTSVYERQDDVTRESMLKKSVPKVVRMGSVVLPLLFIGMGMYLVGSAVVPIVGYYLESSTRASSVAFTAPIPQEQVMEITPLVVTDNQVQAMEQDSAGGPLIIDEELDFTNLANWFDARQLPELAGSGAQEVVLTQYTLEIPSLDIHNAEVAVGGTDLNSSLIAYPGTALPGQPGAPVIFGHSVLRQFYNPKEKNPRRYNSIFSTIMTLKPGDKIYVTADGVKYTYMVQSKTEVKPQDVYILTQQFDAKRLKLVTCTPEGTYLRRGVVTAQLVEGE